MYITVVGGYWSIRRGVDGWCTYSVRGRMVGCCRWSFIRSFVRSFVRSFIRSFVHWFVRWLVGLFVHSFVRWFVRWFVGSFIRSFVRWLLRSFADFVRRSVHSLTLFTLFVVHFVRCSLRSLFTSFVVHFVRCSLRCVVDRTSWGRFVVPRLPYVPMRKYFRTFLGC